MVQVSQIIFQPESDKMLTNHDFLSVSKNMRDVRHGHKIQTTRRFTERFQQLFGACGGTRLSWFQSCCHLHAFHLQTPHPPGGNASLEDAVQ